MTAGQDALIEAMRLEQARIYGQLCREHKPSRDTTAGEQDAKVIRLPRRGAA